MRMRWVGWRERERGGRGRGCMDDDDVGGLIASRPGHGLDLSYGDMILPIESLKYIRSPD